MARGRDEDPDYRLGLLKAMVWGEVSIAGELIPTEAITWSRLRATMERTGNLEAVGVSLVLDFERALVALSRQHPEAASAVITQLFLEPDRFELRDIYNQGRARSSHPVDPDRWIRKALAWMAGYLNGLPVVADKGLPSCEEAWKRAR